MPCEKFCAEQYENFRYENFFFYSQKLLMDLFNDVANEFFTHIAIEYADFTSKSLSSWTSKKDKEVLFVKTSLGLRSPPWSIWGENVYWLKRANCRRAEKCGGIRWKGQCPLALAQHTEKFWNIFLKKFLAGMLFFSGERSMPICLSTHWSILHTTWRKNHTKFLFMKTARNKFERKVDQGPPFL